MYAVGFRDAGLCRWDVSTGEIRRWRLGGRPTALAITPDGQRLVLAFPGRLEVWSR